jgi:hypothetical protein
MNHAVPVIVETGLEEKDQISIAGQIGPGELVVTRGNQRLIPGQEVIVENVKESGLSETTSGPTPGPEARMGGGGQPATSQNAPPSSSQKEE